jgi:16S rRNA (uracil1498-N3)-methyltransferase
VTAPLFWAPADQLAAAGPGATVELSGPEARHAVAVQRLRPGHQILLSDAVGRRLEGRVRSARGGQEPLLTIVVERASALAPRSPQLVLVQALAKGRRDEAAVAAATGLGADRIIPWQADRSVPRWLEVGRGRGGGDLAAGRSRGGGQAAPPNPAAAKGRARWQQVVRAEGKVARRCLLPVVEDAVDSAALAARLAGEIAAGARGVVLRAEADTPLAQALDQADAATAVFLLVGPEGSIAPEEVAAFEAAGALAARLGPEVLRTGLAGAAALTLASHVLGRWGRSHPVD